MRGAGEMNVMKSLDGEVGWSAVKICMWVQRKGQTGVSSWNMETLQKSGGLRGPKSSACLFTKHL